jgi:hypothetical protein
LGFQVTSSLHLSGMQVAKAVQLNSPNRLFEVNLVKETIYRMI